MYTLDTNPIIYYAKDDKAVALPLETLILSSPIYISTITEIELFSSLNVPQSEEERINRLLRALLVVPVDSQIARIAARLRRECRLKLPDSAIAATALFTGTTLVTRNVRDFKRVPTLMVEKI